MSLLDKYIDHNMNKSNVEDDEVSLSIQDIYKRNVSNACRRSQSICVGQGIEYSSTSNIHHILDTPVKRQGNSDESRSDAKIAAMKDEANVEGAIALSSPVPAPNNGSGPIFSDESTDESPMHSNTTGNVRIIQNALVSPNTPISTSRDSVTLAALYQRSRRSRNSSPRKPNAPLMVSPKLPIPATFGLCLSSC